MKKRILILLMLLLFLAGCATPAPTSTEPTADITAPLDTPQLPTEAFTESPTEPEETGLFPEGTETLTAHFIDVGQADSILLECGGEYALIDAGYPEGGVVVVEYLKELGVERLSLVVGTHPHGDHIGGLPEVLNAFPADNVWSSHISYSNDTVRAFLNAVAGQSLPLQKPPIGETFQLGGATITKIGPVIDYYDDVNNMSLVLMVQFGDIKMLFTGDMEREAEEDLLGSGANVKADLLKVGHHGSYTSTSYPFLRAVAPTYGVICVGGNNDYGHPHDEPLSRLRDADVIIYRTDKMYDIMAVTDGTEIRFSWENQYAKPWTPDA